MLSLGTNYQKICYKRIIDSEYIDSYAYILIISSICIIQLYPDLIGLFYINQQSQ